ncbi:HAD family phosphatase [Agriterribacter sp.]|uniref:HAD family hydrolase n=1 Tax=Agriterribacter sp. TaxID=2821509 RepID=UPI002CF41454|nr:HAD family phosphatase [Agriterribacter sp.]HTN08581.1 HAD family phosphatase [Agriterribacter sp.]
MQNIENLIFDLGGVILTLDMPRAEQHFTALGVKDYNTLFRSGNVSSFFKAYEVGSITDAEFMEALRNLAGLPLTDKELVTAWNAMLGYFPEERIALLHRLKTKYRLFLFSNTNALHLTTFRKMYADAFNGNVFDDHFEKAYYSHTLGMRKPDKESYAYIIRENNLDPSKTVFIDDSILNIEGAEATGLKGIHIKPGMSILDIDL